MQKKVPDVDLEHGGPRQRAAWYLFNLGWWLAVTITGYAYLIVSEPAFRHISPWYLWLLVAICPFLLLQAIIYWLFMKLLFRRRRSSLPVSAISAMVLAGLLFLLIINLLRGFPALKT